MPFHVPSGLEGFFDDVNLRFRLLLSKGIITGIDQLRLNTWLANFLTLEDRYLAARMLSSLTYRSEAMVNSSFAHLVQGELPKLLRTHAGVLYADLDAFDAMLHGGQDDAAVRLVAVDGFDDTPGKSGPQLIRQFRRHLGVSKAILCRPDKIAQLPVSVKAIVFLDDLLGTGRQFHGFAEHHHLAEQVGLRTFIYAPLMACEKGLKHLADKCPWLVVHPIESLGEEHRFFRASERSNSIWALDDTNKIEDVREHIRRLCRRNEIADRGKYSLDLTVAFEHSVPNNSVSLLLRNSGSWQPLFDR